MPVIITTPYNPPVSEFANDVFVSSGANLLFTASSTLNQTFSGNPLTSSTAESSYVVNTYEDVIFSGNDLTDNTVDLEFTASST